MPRSSISDQPLPLPPEPDPDKMPIRYGDRQQLSQIHTKYWGKLSPRTLEKWPLDWRIVGGRAVSPVSEFIAEAQRRFDAAPVIRGGRGHYPPEQSAAA
jgi:hypothetical protein